jgi:YVTN family beta-propeller protein
LDRTAFPSYAVVVAERSESSGAGGPSQPRVGEHLPPERGPPEAAVHTFLIVDVRGYTRFTQEHGDEAAGELAAAFAELAREAVQSCGGEVIELRGDEALSVFGSARQALRAAVELQVAFRRRNDQGPTFPLPIGIGLDAGEAVPVEAGYRGGALNTASRLCAMAGPGEILATDTVVSLARRLEGIRFVDRRPARLKGLEKPVRVVEVVPEAGLPPLPEARARKGPRITPGRLVIVAIGGIALVAGLVALGISRSTGHEPLSRVDAHTVGVIDAEAAGIEAQIPIGSRPGAIAAGGGFLWVASEADGTVSRIDPETHDVQTLEVSDSATGVGYGGGSVWVTNGEARTVAQIDPDTLALVQRIEVGNGPGPVAVGKGAVWVANTLDGTVSRIDLAGRAAMQTIPVGADPAGVAVSTGGVWVTSEATGAVLRVDTRSAATVPPVNVGNGPTGIAAGEGSVWVANREDGTISRIDPTTNVVSRTVEVGRNPTAVAVGLGAVWVANAGDATISRIDPTAGEVDETIAVGSSPNALALADGNVWATTLTSPRSHRGGVLKVESRVFPCECSGDPALADVDESWMAYTLVYDGLVAYRRVGGTAGRTLVANLADRLPRPTDEGRTYAFRLRPGLRYSNGTPVRASDFRYSLERTLTMNDYWSYPYEGILGVAACADRAPSERCDLSRGIEVDDAARTMTIRLAQADPDFLHTLTLPFAALVPSGTPLRAARKHPIAGTGPYRILPPESDDELRYVRNPRFEMWSQDRPDGYPDEIRFHLSDDRPATRLTAVERGQADWASDWGVVSAIGVEGRRRLLTRYADRLHTDPVPHTAFMFMNTRVPPFDDLRVRRALNYATDRRELAELAGGPPLAPLTCQILPPGFPGYRPYCPYTLNPNEAGTWTAPDLAKARTLIAKSGTEGMRVEVVSYDEPAGVELARYFVSLLRELGYRSSQKVLSSSSEYWVYVGKPRNRAQLGPQGWVADFLAPSSFLADLFSCDAFRPGPDNNNFSEFCDPATDARMKEAARIQASDPAAANALWADVDQDLVDQAVAVPLSNPRHVAFVSERVGNHQVHMQYGTLLDQLWVK